MAAGLLAACGETTSDRAEGGAAVGAGTGAAIGAVFGGVGAIPGALIGAAVGAGTGAETTPQQVNLGEPVWDKDQPKMADASTDRPMRAALAGDDVRQAQQALRAQGFYRGPIDGIYGPQTRSAVEQYQRRNGLRDTAALDADTMARLNGGTTTTYGSSGSSDHLVGGRQ
ncbi:MAG: peptidoglycan-binding domain-containing protein [Pseudomonadota bacterium]